MQVSNVARRCAVMCAVLGSFIATVFCSTASAGEAKRTAHPDFSGVWIESGAPGPIQLGTPRTVTELPFTAEGKSKVAAFRALLGPQEDRPGNYCLGSGMPESMLFSGITGQYPMEIVQSSDLILVLYESHSEVRHLFLNSKIIPKEDRLPSRNGYSAAHWEGDTLTVETDALKEQVDQAYPHSEKARIIERYRITTDTKGVRILENTWSLIDPAFYTKPVGGVKKWSLDPHGILLPYDCTEQFWENHLDALRNAQAKP